MQIALIACCGEKKQESCKAEDIYKSPLFLLSKTWVKKRNLKWMILSAKHGLLNPDKIIDPYNLSLNNFKKDDLKKWDLMVQSQIKKTFLVPPFFVILAGHKYQGPFKKFNYVDVLKSLGIGQRLKFLKENINANNSH